MVGFTMKIIPLFIIAGSILLGGCDKVQNLTSGAVKCDNEAAKKLVVESFLCTRQIS